MKNSLAIADAIPQLIRLAVALLGERQLSHQAIDEPQRRVRHRELGVDLDGALEEGHGRRQIQFDDRTFEAALYAFKASSDGVVASSSGVSCLPTVASDSPTRVLNLLAI